MRDGSLRDGALTFVTQMEAGVAVPCEKIDLGQIGNGGSWRQYCERFEHDTDGEECDADMRPGCRNCLYRWWTPRGFACVAYQ